MNSTLIGITFYKSAIEYLKACKVKSLSSTLNWFIDHYIKQGSIPNVKIEEDSKEPKQRQLRISPQAKEFLVSNKIAGSISYTVNCLLLDAKAQNLTPF